MPPRRISKAARPGKVQASLRKSLDNGNVEKSIKPKPKQKSKKTLKTSQRRIPPSDSAKEAPKTPSSKNSSIFNTPGSKTISTPFGTKTISTPFLNKSFSTPSGSKSVSTPSGSKEEKVCAFYRTTRGPNGEIVFNKSLLNYFLKCDSPNMDDLKNKRFNTSFRRSIPRSKDHLKIFTEEEDNDPKYFESIPGVRNIPVIKSKMPAVPGTQYADIFKDMPINSDSDEELNCKVVGKKRKSVRKSIVSTKRRKPHMRKNFLLPPDHLTFDYNDLFKSDSVDGDPKNDGKEKEDTLKKSDDSMSKSSSKAVGGKRKPIKKSKSTKTSKPRNKKVLDYSDLFKFDSGDDLKNDDKEKEDTLKGNNDKEKDDTLKENNDKEKEDTYENNDKEKEDTLNENHDNEKEDTWKENNGSILKSLSKAEVGKERKSIKKSKSAKRRPLMRNSFYLPPDNLTFDCSDLCKSDSGDVDSTNDDQEKEDTLQQINDEEKEDTLKENNGSILKSSSKSVGKERKSINKSKSTKKSKPLMRNSFYLPPDNLTFDCSDLFKSDSVNVDSKNDDKEKEDTLKKNNESIIKTVGKGRKSIQKRKSTKTRKPCIKKLFDLDLFKSDSGSDDPKNDDKEKEGTLKEDKGKEDTLRENNDDEKDDTLKENNDIIINCSSTNAVPYNFKNSNSLQGDKLLSPTKDEEIILNKYKDIMANQQCFVILPKIPYDPELVAKLCDKKTSLVKPTGDIIGKRKVTKGKGLKKNKLI